MRRRFLKDKTSYDFSNYMTFEVLGDGFQFQPPRDVEYSCNGGGWEILSKNKYSPSFMVGDFVSVKCVLERNETFGLINTNGKPFDLRGNALSLIYGDKIINNIEDYPYVFRHLFGSTIGLRHVEKSFLPATTLSEGCYQGMFFNSTIVTAPELPATTLAEYCYEDMFNYCASLTTAPELPATTLAEYCYEYMFSGCSSLAYIKAMFLTNPYTGGANPYRYTRNWVLDVASSGTFVKNKNATWNVIGTSGIPSGWTVQNA